MKKPELLLPAGNLNKLKIAILYGADAVYAGTPSLSLRNQSDFGFDEIKEGIEFVRKHNKKIYLTLNIFAHNHDIEKLEEFSSVLEDLSPDGVLIADPGVFAFVKERLPNIKIHISTQSNICSWKTVDFWAKQGADLCVLAREVSFKQLKEIRERCTDIKLEAFIHGSMCMTYSGRCLLSNFMAERGANQGSCAHSCRWGYDLKLRLNAERARNIHLDDVNKNAFDYYLEEGLREGEYYKIEEDDRGSYILNSKDMCLMPVLKDYLEIGIDTLKVEGRHKGEYYVALVAKTYRRAIDSYFKDKENWTPNEFMEELNTTQNRGFTLGFHHGRLENIAHNYNRTRTIGSYFFAGIIIKQESDGIIMEVKNLLEEGDILDFIIPFDEESIRLRVYEFIDADTKVVKSKVSAGQKQSIFIPYSAFANYDEEYLKYTLLPLTIVRKEMKNLPQDTKNHITLDKMSFLAEQGKIEKDALNNLKENAKKDHSNQKPRKGENGCCARGCNGCLNFWQDEKYQKLRDSIKLQKGKRLPKSFLEAEK